MDNVISLSDYRQKSEIALQCKITTKIKEGINTIVLNSKTNMLEFPTDITIKDNKIATLVFILQDVVVKKQFNAMLLPIERFAIGIVSEKQLAICTYLREDIAKLRQLIPIADKAPLDNYPMRCILDCLKRRKLYLKFIKSLNFNVNTKKETLCQRIPTKQLKI